MNLISIIEEAEKEFDKIYNENGFILTEREIKFHYRQTILKLVEGIEKWADDNKVRCEECENKEIHDIDPVNKNLDDLLLLLTDLKDKLKQ